MRGLIVGMDGLPPPLDSRRVGVDRMPELRPQAVVPPHRVGGEVPVPDRLVGGAAEEGQALVALADDLAQLAAQAGHFLLVVFDDAAKTVLLGEGGFTCRGYRRVAGSAGRRTWCVRPFRRGRRLSRKLADDYGGCGTGLQAQSGLAVAASAACARRAVRHYTQGFLAAVPLTHCRGGPPSGGCRSGGAGAPPALLAGFAFPGRRAPFERPTWPKPN